MSQQRWYLWLTLLGGLLALAGSPLQAAAQERTATVYLGLRLADGTWVAGAEAQLLPYDQGRYQTCVTDARGICPALVLAPGRYVIRWSGVIGTEAIASPEEQGGYLGHGGEGQGLGMLLTDAEVGKAVEWLFVLERRGMTDESARWYPVQDVGTRTTAPTPLASSLPADPLRPVGLPTLTPLPNMLSTTPAPAGVVQASPPSPGLANPAPTITPSLVATLFVPNSDGEGAGVVSPDASPSPSPMPTLGASPETASPQPSSPAPDAPTGPGPGTWLLIGLWGLALVAWLLVPRLLAARQTQGGSRQSAHGEKP